MQVVQVNVSDPYSLKILYPSIRLAIGGNPAYGRIVYSDFPYPMSDRTELFLEQSAGGFNLGTHLGLAGFLRQVGYMSVAKLGRFEAAGRERVVDSAGREVVAEGIFHKNPSVADMYFYCSTLRLANRSFVDEPIELSYILDLLESPLYQRLLEADRVGHERLLERVLQLLDSFYSADMQFRARGTGRASGFDRMAQLMNVFDSQGFRGFSLSGDLEQDTYVFLTLFGEP